MKIVCMAGGGGTRLWPVSTEDFPKQFLSLGFERSLLQQTYDRVSPLITPQDYFITANKNYAELLEEQLSEIPREHFFYEPAKRDNAAAVALTLKRLIHLGYKDEIMVMLSADHFIKNTTYFLEILNTATAFVEAHNEYILTIGIEPTYPETGYGYIETTDNVLSEDNALCVKAVKRFTEKPDLATATDFIKQGNFYWNSGMFIWHIGAMWSLFEEFLPDITNALDSIDHYIGSDDEENVLNELYPTLQATSIDFGIMEKAQHIGIVPAKDLGWTDIGNWKSVMNLFEKDPAGNVNLNNATLLDAKNSFTYGEGKKVYMFGGQNIGIIQTDGEIFILDLDKSSDIKTFLKHINI